MAADEAPGRRNTAYRRLRMSLGTTLLASALTMASAVSTGILAVLMSLAALVGLVAGACLATLAVWRWLDGHGEPGQARPRSRTITSREPPDMPDNP
jgi:hypothetical protein